MNLNDSIKKRKMLIKYKNALLAFTLMSSLSFSSSAQTVDDKVYNDKIFNKFYFASTQILVNKLNKTAIDVRDSWKPENLDFSDFPYRDGSVESMVRIANYIREKVKHIPNVIKYNYIMNHYIFNEEEFNTSYVVIHLEGKPDDGAYELAFANTTNVFNRVISSYKSKMIANKNNIDEPVSFFQHITAKSQYSPYGSGDYLNYTGFRDSETYQAFLDSLFVMDVIPERMHDFLDFRATKYEPDCVQIVKGGNWFRNILKEDDIIPLEERYYYVEDKIVDEQVFTKHLG